MMDEALIEGSKGVVRRLYERESRWMDGLWLEIC
jgi:hypothetical protein